MFSAWDNTEPVSTAAGPLPPVNPWDVAPNPETAESTGWANFDNFENTLSIENKEGEDRESTSDERKERTPETTAVDLNKKIPSEIVGWLEMISNVENGGNNNGKTAEASPGNQALAGDLPAAAAAAAESNKSEEEKKKDKSSCANETVNSNEVPEVSSRYFTWDNSDSKVGIGIR